MIDRAKEARLKEVPRAAPEPPKSNEYVRASSGQTGDGTCRFGRCGTTAPPVPHLYLLRQVSRAGDSGALKACAHGHFPVLGARDRLCRGS